MRAIGRVKIGGFSKKRMLVMVALFLFSSLFISQGHVQAESYIERVSGDNRIETAIQISQTGWDTAESVILARADNPADALSSASLSGSVDAPILLTYTNKIQQNVIDEIVRLQASTVYILGSSGAISGEVATKLSNLGLTVKRLGGATRFETASIINQEAKTSLNTKAIIVSGYAVADALSAASNSANNLIPIYLSTKTTLPVSLPANVKEVTIYGGSMVIGLEVDALLSKKGIKVTRISGMNRYETNIKSADENLKENVIIVRGTSIKEKTEDFPDAVAGAGLSHRLKANIILSDPSASISVLVDYFANHRYQNVYILGGESAVSTEVVNNYDMFIHSTINHVFDFIPAATAENPANSIIYMLDDNENAIKSYNYVTKEHKSVKLSGKPEQLYVRNNKIYITIVDKPHSDYWWDDEQSGGIDIVDSDSFQFVKSIRIDIDPFDIVVDNKGIMYISSGSGQWTNIKSYSSETGAKLSSIESIRQQSYLEIHPNQTKLYSLSIESPGIKQHTIQDGKLTISQEFPYQSHNLRELIKMSPDGQYLFNSIGYVYDGNLTHIGNLQVPFTDITFNLEQDRFFTAFEDVIYENDDFTLEYYDYYITNGEVKQIYYKNGQIIILSQVTVGQTNRIALETLSVPSY